MNPSRIATVVVLLSALTHVYAAPAVQDSGPSDDALKRIRINLCEHSAETARSITRATIKGKLFDATKEVLAQTVPGSDERKIMQQLFQRGGLISSVLIQSANYGLFFASTSEVRQATEKIDELTYDYVRSMCIAASLDQ